MQYVAQQGTKERTIFCHVERFEALKCDTIRGPLVVLALKTRDTYHAILITEILEDDSTTYVIKDVKVLRAITGEIRIKTEVLTKLTSLVDASRTRPMTSFLTPKLYSELLSELRLPLCGFGRPIVAQHGPIVA